jgi:hypothetical protein
MADAIVPPGGSVDFGGLIIRDDGPILSGTGRYDTFLALHGNGNDGTEQGFNLNHDGQALLNETTGRHTHTLQLNNIGEDDTGNYYVFRLDIDEPNSDGKGEVVLTDLEFYTSALGATDANWNGSATPLTGLNLIKAFKPNVTLSDHSHGSGTDDYVILVDKSLFAGVNPADFLTVYAKFSGNDGGFEEFRAKPADDDDGDGDSAPSLLIIKDTLAPTANGTSVEDQTVLTGTHVVWTYTVTNSGNVDLTNIKVTDDELVVPVYQSGDTGPGGTGAGDGVLSPGETWVYTAEGDAGHGFYDNIGTATGDGFVTDLLGIDHPITVEDSDDSNYTGIEAKIQIDKLTLDGQALGGLATDFLNARDGANILSGEAVTWIYKVTNGGDDPLSNVQVSDNQSGVSPVYVTGDDGDGVLAAGETWYYAASGTAVTGNYNNTGQATGEVTDSINQTDSDSASDDSSYFGANPGIDVEKYVSVDGGVTWLDADTATGPVLTEASPYDPKFRFVIHNTGNVDLTGVTLHDDKFDLNGAAPGTDLTFNLAKDDGVANDGAGAVESADTHVVTFTAPWAKGQHEDTATASGTYADTAGHSKTVSDTDQAHYYGFANGDGVKGHALTQGFWGQHQEAWNGTVAYVKGVADTQNLVTSGVLTKLDVLPTGATGILLGDADGNGATNGTENTLFVSFAAARQIIMSSDSANDTRQILMKQALAAQLNIYNGVKDPNDLVGEAVTWLKGGPSTLNPNSPYAYTDGSSGKVDTNQDGVLSSSEYNTTSKAFTFDANGSTRTGNALTSSLDAWQKNVDVYNAASTTVWADGQGLKNALEAFNLDKLVTSSDGALVGWTTDHGLTVTNVYDNTVLDNFWLTLSNTAGFALA